MSKIKDVLHEKRGVTEDHIKKLEQSGKEGVRYTAGIIYLCNNGFHHALDYVTLVALVAVVFGVGYIIYLNKIHEKEIATKLQKDLSFGMTVYAGLAGAIVGILQLVTYTSVSSEIVWIVVGGFLNFAAGAPIYFSFKKGIFYGVK